MALLSIHAMMATFFKAQEFELDAEEAARIATALARVARHYPVLEQINDRAVDHFNLFTVLTGVYGLRFMTYKMRTAAEKARPTTATVTPIFRAPNS